MELDDITTSQALQIAGRAGRFNTQFQDGFVTAFKEPNLVKLRQILGQPLEKISRAGLHPTSDQIELFAYHLPSQSLSNLIKIFMNICHIDLGQYFLCNFEDMLALAELIDHIPIKLKTKYVFATSPINRKEAFLTSCFVKFVRFYSNNEPVTADVLKKMIGYPWEVPDNMTAVQHLEVVFDVLDLYLWLCNRFPEIYCYREEVVSMRIDLEAIIYKGVKVMSKLGNTGSGTRVRSLQQRQLIASRTAQNANSSNESRKVKQMFTNTTNSNASNQSQNQSEYSKEKDEILRSDTLSNPRSVASNKNNESPNDRIDVQNANNSNESSKVNTQIKQMFTNTTNSNTHNQSQNQSEYNKENDEILRSGTLRNSRSVGSKRNNRSPNERIEQNHAKSPFNGQVLEVFKKSAKKNK